MYEKVEEQEHFLPQNSHTAQSRDSTQRHFSSTRWFYLVLLILCLSASSALAGVWVGAKWFSNPDDFCIRYTNKYSPIVDEAELGYNTIRFNGSLLKPNTFRQDAGPEVDAAWSSLGIDYRPLAIPADKARQSGLLPDQVKIKKKYGGGYPANVEGLHHLHCLNLLRKALWYNYDYYHEQGLGAFLNEDYVVKYHVTHCLDIIRQQLMCQTNTAVLGQVWIQPGNETHPSAYVDFNTYQTCKNFEAVRAWAEEHQLPADVPQDLLEPPKPGDKIYDENP